MNPSAQLAKIPWRKGALLAFSGLDGKTCYESGLAGRAIDGPPGLELRDPALCRIRFEAEQDALATFGGDFFEVQGKEGRVRGAFVDAHHLLIEGTASVELCEPGLRTLHEGNRLLVGTATHFRPECLSLNLDDLVEARSAWLLEQKWPASLPETSRNAYLRALSLMKGQVCSPEGKLTRRWTTPDRWPHKDMWLWDTAFHAIGWRHLDPGLAMEMIDTLFDLQREDGFLTYRGSPGGPTSHLGALMTQPPVLAHAVWLVFQVSDDLKWLRRIHPKLTAYLQWDLAHRDADGAGLMEWFIEDDPACRSGESGMDNSPRFDDARQIDAVDFNSFLAGECNAMAEISRALGERRDATDWRNTHDRLARLINERMWHEAEGFYCDSDPASGQPIPLLTSAGFLPLYAGVVPPERLVRLAEALRDPEKFGTAFPVASVAAQHQSHYSKDMWRGPTWINVNWLITDGFARQGLAGEAQELRLATVAEIERWFDRFGVFFEYYDDRGEVAPPELLRKLENTPENPYRQVIHDFGWTATLYLDLVWQLHSHDAR